jgi:parallel beta-helix repeat protein
VDGKKNAKIIAFTLVIAFVLSAGIASALSNSGGGEWKYNKVTAIKENSGKALTDYQVSIELKGSDFPEEAKSDGCDIRFSDPGGKELSYWIDEFDPSTRTYEIWVKVSEIPASGTVTVLMYYGNPSAGVVSDGDATFVFFDDFETPVYQEEDGWCDSYSHTRIGTTWQQQNVYCDYVFITKYADPEPIATIGIETNVNAVSDCVVIKSPGYYELAEDIMNCTTKHCITITASDVVLDGAGHTIDGGYANASIERFCIYVKNSSTALSNVTVKNLNVTGWNTGIYFYRVKNSRIENNQVNNNKNGIYLVYSNHISLTNNTVYNNSVHGINLVVLHDNHHKNSGN